MENKAESFGLEDCQLVSIFHSLIKRFDILKKYSKMKSIGKLLLLMTTEKYDDDFINSLADLILEVKKESAITPSGEQGAFLMKLFTALVMKGALKGIKLF
jgi:hypothetical protein